MPESVLVICKIVFLAVLYLFIARVVRAVWVEIFAERRALAEDVASGTGRNAGARTASKTDAVSRTAEPGALGSSGRRRKSAPQFVIRVVEPAEQRGTTYTVTDEAVIGRSTGCAIPLEDTFASQIHARFFVRDSALFVEDLGSTNGTFLNRKQLHGPVAVHGRDRVQVGNTVLEVQR